MIGKLIQWGITWWLLTVTGILSIFLGGCTSTIRNHGESGIRFGNEITFFSCASQTSAEPAVVKVELPALEELIMAPDEEADDGGS